MAEVLTETILKAQMASMEAVLNSTYTISLENVTSKLGCDSQLAAYLAWQDTAI